MPRLAERPDLRVIEGGLAQGSDAGEPTSPQSQSSPSRATTQGSTVEGPPSSTCAPSKTGNELRVLIAGSRTWDDYIPVYLLLLGLQEWAEGRPIVVAHGGAQGADTVADNYGKFVADDVRVYPADWDRHGRRAGFLRNKEMVEEFKPHVVLAFSEHPITKGTQHTVTLAQKANIPVYVIGHGLTPDPQTDT